MNATSTIDEAAVARFLGGTRLALIGASDNPTRLASTIERELTEHGYDVVPVNPGYDVVAGRPCYPTVGEVPGEIDGAIVMVSFERAPEVVQQCIDAYVPRVWLFKGLGGPGATSPAASRMFRAAGINIIDGACPLMFLEPVGWCHRVHHMVRRARGHTVTAVGNRRR